MNIDAYFALPPTSHQRDMVALPIGQPQSLFIEGPAGAGKTTAGVARLRRLLVEGVPGESILVLTPQRTLGRAYCDALRAPGVPAGSQVDVLTIGGLAQRAVDLYWPEIAGPAGFAHPEQAPVYLTLETAQYYMERLIAPYLEQGAFGDVSLAPERLISQILDNLNKAAIARFPADEIGARLSRAWAGESSRARVYEQVQSCCTAFRNFCLQHNLLDFSLQVELFGRYVLALPQAAMALRQRYRHLIVDNVEEDVPLTHDLLVDWLGSCSSAWLICDDQGGLRSYLGADPQGAYGLRERCLAHERLAESLVCRAPVQALAGELARSLGFGSDAPAKEDPRPAVTVLHHDLPTDAIRNVVDEVARLVHDQGVPPEQIAILAPFMGDALRFSLSTGLARHDVPSYSQRPSRALQDEPAARCLLTLAKLARPERWPAPPKIDVVHAWLAAIGEMDLVRAWHLTEIVYRPAGGRAKLATFAQIQPAEQAKITYVLGNRYEALRQWLAAYAEGPLLPLDLFWLRLFDEALAQPGYIFHYDRDAAAITAHLVDSARRFRLALGEGDPEADTSFVRLVESGVIGAQYLPPLLETPPAVLLAPAYTFVMADRPVDVQFWLDLASPTWGRRLFQPLTHPYVLGRHWPADAQWADADEDLANRQTLYRLVVGLLRRCRKQVYMADSTYNERGQEEHGALQQAVFRVLRRAARAEVGNV